MSRKNGGGIPSQGVKASTVMPAIGRRPKAPEYHPEIIVTLENGEVTSSLSRENKSERALTLFDNELGRFAVALREGKSGSFTLHPDDYVAILNSLGRGSDIPNLEPGKLQSSTVVYMFGGRILSTLLIKNSAHCIDQAVLDENIIHVTNALQGQDVEQYSTWRISTRDYLTLLVQNYNGFQQFRRITSNKDGTIAVADKTMRLSGRYTMGDFAPGSVDSLWKLLKGGNRRVRDLVLREEDIPFLSSESEGSGDRLLNYVVLSQGEVIQCLELENRTDAQLPFFDTTIGKFVVARQDKTDGTFLVNKKDYDSLTHAESQGEGEERILDETDSVIVYIDSGRIVSTQPLYGSKHHIDKSVLVENDGIVSTSLGDSVFGGTWRISAGTYQSLRKQNTEHFQFFSKITRHTDGTVTVGDKIQLDGYHDMSQYMKGPVGELVRFLSLKSGAKKLEREYILRDEDVEALIDLLQRK